MDLIRPEWPVPARVRAVMTRHRNMRAKTEGARAAAGRAAMAAPGARCERHRSRHAACQSAKATRRSPVHRNAYAQSRPPTACRCSSLTQTGSVIGAAHAGWRGLCAGSSKRRSTDGRPRRRPHRMARAGHRPEGLRSGRRSARRICRSRSAAEVAFTPTRPGHWLLDLYAVARQRLARAAWSSLRRRLLHLLGTGSASFRIAAIEPTDAWRR